MDLHQGFREPARAPAQELARFLADVDRLPGIRAIRGAMREAVALQPGMRLLDAGCGSGIETARLAQANPRALITGWTATSSCCATRRAARPGSRATCTSPGCPPAPSTSCAPSAC